MASTYDTPDSIPPDKRPRGGYSAPPPEESPHKDPTADPKKEYVASTGYGAGLRDYLRALPVYVDDLTREVDLQVYERMRWDECVAGSLDALVYQALADDIDFRPAVDDEDSQYYDDSKTQADTMNRLMADMERPLIEWAYEMVSDAIGGGNRVSEKVVRQEEGGPYSGLWVWDRLKVKPRRHLSFAMDSFNNLRGILTAIPGTYMGLDGSIPVDPEKTPNLLPREKFAVLSWNSHNDDPRGRPLLRRVYIPWWEKLQVASEWLKHLARFGSPSLVGTTAPNSDFVPPQDEFGNALSGTAPGPEQVLLNRLEDLQNGGCLALPYGATVTALQVAQSGEAFVQKIEQCDRAITRGTLLAIRAVMEAQHGSKADSQTAQDVTGLVVRYVKNWAARMITHDLVKPLVRWNKGADAARVICPYASLTPVEHQDWSQKATAVAALKTSGFLKPSQEPALAEEMGLPPATEPVEQPQPQPPQGQQPGQNGAEVSGDNPLSPEAATFAGPPEERGKDDPGPSGDNPLSPDAAPFAGEDSFDLGDISLGGLSREEIAEILIDAALDARDDAEFAWEESKHPRGQPENKGEFGPGGGDGTRPEALPQTGDKAERRTRQEQYLARVQEVKKKINPRDAAAVQKLVRDMEKKTALDNNPGVDENALLAAMWRAGIAVGGTGLKQYQLLDRMVFTGLLSKGISGGSLGTPKAITYHLPMRQENHLIDGAHFADAEFAAWDEAKHPRGQPENKGQFRPGGGGAQITPTATWTSEEVDTLRAVTMQWRGKLTSDEREAIVDYTLNSSMNYRLRSGTTSRHDDVAIEEIDSALEKASLPFPVSLFRGISHGSFEVGDTFFDEGYTSASRHEHMAEEFARDDGSVFEMRLPQGFSAAWIATLSPSYSSEGEFLLPRDLSFRIIEAHADNRYVVEIVQDAEFFDPNQLRDHRGRWTTGGGSGTSQGLPHAERQAQRESARETVRAFMAGKGSPSLKEASGLAQALSTLTVAQLHEVKREHGLKASSKDKAGLVAKLAERFRAAREAKPAEKKPAPAPVPAQTPAAERPTDAVFLTPDNLQIAWEYFKEEISGSDPKLSPLRAGELAAARLRHAIQQRLVEVEGKTRSGMLSPEEEAFYDRIYVEEWNPTRQLEKFSGSRSLIADADDPLAQRPLDADRLPDRVGAARREKEDLARQVEEVNAHREENARARQEKHKVLQEQERAKEVESKRQWRVRTWFVQQLGSPWRGLSPEKWEANKRTHVADLLAAGKPVPAEVLKDYPDLQPKGKDPDLRREAVKSAIGDTYSKYNGTHQLLQDIAGKHDTLASALAEAERQGLIDTRQRSPQTDVSPLQTDRQGEWVRRVLTEAYEKAGR